MRETPPQNLIDQLQRLELASGQQVRGMYGRVRRLARDLPLFESVWVDALAQARILTPYQAAELNAGRGDRLRGPWCSANRSRLGLRASYRPGTEVASSRSVGRRRSFGRSGRGWPNNSTACPRVGGAR